MRKLKYLLVLVALSLTACQRGDSPQPLDSGLTVLKIDPFSVTLSGFSSGAYMAQQFHFAHSDRVRGVALLGAGPYDCARGELNTAVEQCMFSPIEPLQATTFRALAEQRAQSRQIQPLSNLRSDHVWLFRGNADPLLPEAVFTQAAELYNQFVEPGRLTVEKRAGVGHVWPTKDFGVACSGSEAPFIGLCGYDAAGEFLTALYGFMHEPAEQAGEVIEFDQTLAVGSSVMGLAETGYAYIPQDCVNGSSCSLHINFHDCSHSAEAVGDNFVRNNGLNEWAETNRIVVLYPQAAATEGSENMQACWDWWGYTGADYATLDGVQIEAVVRMISHIAGVEIPEEEDL